MGQKYKKTDKTFGHTNKNTIFVAIKKHLKMKYRLFILVFILFISFFFSCTTDVDLYAEYKDEGIVYAMLDPRADTNYVKITRAFCGTNDNQINANEVALIADSSNYPGKLDARIIELISTHGGPYEPTGRVIVLDTITLHNKEEGTFYAPDQCFYYTTEPIHAGEGRNRYKYRLRVMKPNGDSLTATTDIVGNEEFAIMTGGVSFRHAPTYATGKILFMADGNASLYEVTMQFNYREQKAGQEMKQKTVSRSFGPRTLIEYIQLVGSDNCYYLEYSVNWLFIALTDAIGGDTIHDANHPDVTRYIDDFVITISAAGDELTNYYLAHEAQANSPVSLISNYTNIEGGYGLFSSRVKIERSVYISANTRKELFGISSWGFKEQ